MSVWRHYDIVKQYWRRHWVRDITRISCFLTTMKLPHSLQIYSSFCKEVYRVCGCIFKVVQQQTIGEVGNPIMCLRADNFCLQQWKNKRRVFAKVMCTSTPRRARATVELLHQETPNFLACCVQAVASKQPGSQSCGLRHLGCLCLCNIVSTRLPQTNP